MDTKNYAVLLGILVPRVCSRHGPPNPPTTILACIIQIHSSYNHLSSRDGCHVCYFKLHTLRAFMAIAFDSQFISGRPWRMQLLLVYPICVVSNDRNSQKPNPINPLGVVFLTTFICKLRDIWRDTRQTLLRILRKISSDVIFYDAALDRRPSHSWKCRNWSHDYLSPKSRRPSAYS